MVESLKSSKESFDLKAIIEAAKSQGDGSGQRPVEKWNPEYCGEMDMVIRADGSWWHEGVRITREPLVKLFASILRKDDDGETYLVTPAEKIKISVEKGHFIAIRVDREGEGLSQRLFFTTNLGEVVEAGPDRPITVDTDNDTNEPTPYIKVRGRLDALLTRATFYDLVEMAVAQEKNGRTELGIYSGGSYFSLGNIE